MLLKNRILVLVLFSLGAALLAHADTCPVPPTSVYPNISVKVDYDKKSKFYTYTYSVENRRESKVSIESFMLQISEKPYSSQSPSQWLGDFNEGDAELPPTFGWAPALDLIKPG